MISFLEHIEIKPAKRFGKATIKGTRISVYDVLNWLANGMTNEETAGDFPELSEEKIQACQFLPAKTVGIKPRQLFHRFPLTVIL